MAEVEGAVLGRFLTTLHDEVLAHRGEVRNFSSLLRCACLVHLSRAATPAAVHPPFLTAAE